MSSSRRRTLITIALAIPILLVSMLGFGTKFIEFINTFRGESDGAFAITPMVNYLCASAGFLCMLIWAVMNGVFRDMERPKDVMLEQELELDRRHPVKVRSNRY
jgi:hypothetical protein